MVKFVLKFKKFDYFVVIVNEIRKKCSVLVLLKRMKILDVTNFEFLLIFLFNKNKLNF